MPDIIADVHGYIMRSFGGAAVRRAFALFLLALMKRGEIYWTFAIFLPRFPGEMGRLY